MDSIGGLASLPIWAFLVFLAIWGGVLPAAAIFDILRRPKEVTHPVIKVVALLAAIDNSPIGAPHERLTGAPRPQHPLGG